MKTRKNVKRHANTIIQAKVYLIEHTLLSFLSEYIEHSNLIVF